MKFKLIKSYILIEKKKKRKKLKKIFRKFGHIHICRFYTAAYVRFLQAVYTRCLQIRGYFLRIYMYICIWLPQRKG